MCLCFKWHQKCPLTYTESISKQSIEEPSPDWHCFEYYGWNPLRHKASRASPFRLPPKLSHTNTLKMRQNRSENERTSIPHQRQVTVPCLHCVKTRNRPLSSWYWSHRAKIGDKKCIVAVSRKMLSLIYYLFVNDLFYDFDIAMSHLRIWALSNPGFLLILWALFYFVFIFVWAAESSH